MGKEKYVFDSDSFNVDSHKRKGRRIFSGVLKILAASIALTAIYYLVFAVFFSTDQERALQNENRMLERMYPELSRKAALLDDVVEGLKMRDRKIYEDIFETEAPELDRLLDVKPLPLTDSIADEDVVMLTEAKADILMKSAVKVEESMRRIFELCSEDGFSMPPMHLPLRKFSIPMTGASVGDKMNPFYKVIGEHDGLDFMAPLGDDVIAAGDGTVIEVSKSRKGSGNVVAIDHGNGYVTRYAHLQDIGVRKYAKVKRGDVIGHIGMSGASYAPHLHYEVWKDTLLCDPVNYFFGSVTPEEYAGMFIVSIVTGQSLD